MGTRMLESGDDGKTQTTKDRADIGLYALCSRYSTSVRWSPREAVRTFGYSFHGITKVTVEQKVGSLTDERGPSEYRSTNE